MVKRLVLGWLLLGLMACEPFTLDRKTFPVCATPRADIGVTSDRLDVTFYLENPQGDFTIVGWDPGDGKGRNRIGPRVTYNYEQPGTYTITLTLVNGCDDKFTATQQITLYN